MATMVTGKPLNVRLHVNCLCCIVLLHLKLCWRQIHIHFSYNNYSSVYIMFFVMVFSCLKPTCYSKTVIFLRPLCYIFILKLNDLYTPHFISSVHHISFQVFFSFIKNPYANSLQKHKFRSFGNMWSQNTNVCPLLLYEYSLKGTAVLEISKFYPSKTVKANYVYNEERSILSIFFICVSATYIIF